MNFIKRLILICSFVGIVSFVPSSVSLADVPTPQQRDEAVVQIYEMCVVLAQQAWDMVDARDSGMKHKEAKAFYNRRVREMQKEQGSFSREQQLMVQYIKKMIDRVWTEKKSREDAAMQEFDMCQERNGEPYKPRLMV